MENPKEPEAVSEHYLPEWETSARHRGEKQASTAQPRIKHRAIEAFERAMPAHRRYCGLTRRLACIVILAIVVAILVLIIGLAAGLSSHSKSVSPLFPVQCLLLTMSS